MKELSKSPLWAVVFACAALLAGCRTNEQHPALTIPVSSSGVPAGFRDISKLPGTVFQVTYTPATVRIDLPAVQKSLTSVSGDGRVLVFDSQDVLACISSNKGRCCSWSTSVCGAWMQ
jgi:hypothetical protein